MPVLLKRISSKNWEALGLEHFGSQLIQNISTLGTKQNSLFFQKKVSLALLYRRPA